MKNKILWIIVVSLSVSFQSLAQSGYHYKGMFIPLVPDTNAIYFVQPRASQSEKISTEKILSKQLGSSRGQMQKVSDDRYYVTRQRIEDDRLYVSDIYNDNRGNKCVIVPRIAIGLMNGAGIDIILRNYPNLAVIKHDDNVPVLADMSSASKEYRDL